MIGRPPHLYVSFSTAWAMIPNRDWWRRTWVLLRLGYQSSVLVVVFQQKSNLITEHLLALGKPREGGCIPTLFNQVREKECVKISCVRASLIRPIDNVGYGARVEVDVRNRQLQTLRVLHHRLERLDRPTLNVTF